MTRMTTIKAVAAALIATLSLGVAGASAEPKVKPKRHDVVKPVGQPKPPARKAGPVKAKPHKAGPVKPKRHKIAPKPKHSRDAAIAHKRREVAQAERELTRQRRQRARAIRRGAPKRVIRKEQRDVAYARARLRELRAELRRLQTRR
ncbi:MAG: hypothetical protein MRY74_07135 [Neomegalonema sp.]|nr:hypothetical protein [Neomegalonema sp.]